MTAPIVIIGAGMAGARACVELRGHGYEGEIVLIGDEKLLPYDRPPLSKASIFEESEAVPIWLMEETTVRELRVAARTGVQATSIDPAEKSVSLNDGSALAYSKLLLATGAKPRKLTLPGGEQALTLRNHDDALKLRKRFLPGKNIVIIGGGFIGLELASSAIKKACNVVLVEAQPRILMRGVPEAISQIIHDEHVKNGVAMHVGVGVSHITAEAVHLADGRTLPADTIIAGIGAAPDVRLAQDAGLAIENGIACNEQMQTSDPDIYAAGDCASWINPRYGRRMRLEAWRSAQEQAATAAENMLGRSRAHSSTPWFWSDQYDLGLQIVGFAEKGPNTVSRRSANKALVLFHLAEDGTLMGASGIGPGTAISRDIKVAEIMIAKSTKPPVAALADPNKPLKSILRE